MSFGARKLHEIDDCVHQGAGAGPPGRANGSPHLAKPQVTNYISTGQAYRAEALDWLRMHTIDNLMQRSGADRQEQHFPLEQSAARAQGVAAFGQSLRRKGSEQTAGYRECKR